MRLSRMLVRPTVGWVCRRRVRGVLAGLAGVLVAVPLMVAAPSPAAADEGGVLGPWRWSSHWPQGNPLTAVHFSDADTGIAVGRMGTILRTTDGGTSWVPQPNPITEANDHHAFSDVWFDDTDSDFGVAVSHGGNGTTLRDDLFVFRTFDGGVTWDEVQVPDTVAHLEAVSFADADNGYAVGASRSDPDIGVTAVVLRTGDGGATWQDVSPPSAHGELTSNYQLYGVDAVAAGSVVAVGNDGTIVRSDDGGQNWAVLANDFARPLPTSQGAQYRDVSFRTPDVGWVIGTGGRIWHTTNGGQSWSQQPSGGTNSLRGVVFTDTDTGWIAVSDGTLLHTSNGGAAWQQREIFTGTALPLNAVSFPQPEVGVVVGAAGVILRTEDGGDTWVEQSHRPSTLTDLNAVATAPGTGTAMAVGNAGTVLHSQDAGQTWTPLPAPGSETLEDVVLLDPDTGIAVGGTGISSPGVVLRTTDGGQSWQRQQLGSGRLHSVTCPSETTCVAAGARATVILSGDGGQTWQDVSPPADMFLPGRSIHLYGISCPELDTCVAVGPTGGIIRTEDGGQSWQPLHTTNTPFYQDVHFTDADTGWVAGGGPGVLLHTSDGGHTWQEMPLVPAAGGSPSYESISFADRNTGTVVGLNGYTWRTEDGGQTWVEEQRRTNLRLNAVAHIDSDTAVAVGREGTILLRGDGGPVEPPPGVSQEIIATVPDQPGEGSLIVSVDPDDRTVVLPPVELAGAGDRLATTGELRPVTVTDTRTADPGWDTSAQVSNFSSDEAGFGGGFLGWTPQVASQSPGQQAMPGEPVVPGFPTGEGLSVPRTLASAPAEGGLGVAQLGAGLALHLPVETPPGTYTAVLTVTAI